MKAQNLVHDYCISFSKSRSYAYSMCLIGIGYVARTISRTKKDDYCGVSYSRNKRFYPKFRST